MSLGECSLIVYVDMPLVFDSVQKKCLNFHKIPYSRFFSRALNFTIFADFLLIVKIKSSNV